jgi:hypothetical protein
MKLFTLWLVSLRFVQFWYLRSCYLLLPYATILSSHVTFSAYCHLILLSTLPLPFVIVVNHHHPQLLLLIGVVTNNCYYYSSSLTSTWWSLKYLQGTLSFVVHFIYYYNSSLTIVCVLLSSYVPSYPRFYFIYVI